MGKKKKEDGEREGEGRDEREDNVINANKLVSRREQDCELRLLRFVA